jgi:hypothetical protein
VFLKEALANRRDLGQVAEPGSFGVAESKPALLPSNSP